MDIFKSLPGMPGLFLASLFSASLSTLSSGLSSLSALMWTDFIKPRVGEVSEFKATVIAKICVVIFGLCGCGVALLVSLIGGTLIQISTSLLAAFAGPLTGLFLMGCFCPWVNAKGAFIGGFLSLVFSSWLSLGIAFSKSVKKTPYLPLASTDKCLANHKASSFFNTTTTSVLDLAIHGYERSTMDSMWNMSYYEYDSVYGFQFDSTVAMSAGMDVTTAAPSVAETGPQGVEVIYTLSYQWLAPVGIFITIGLGSLISIITGGNKEGEVHPRYLISFCDQICCCLPASVRKLFKCADNYSSIKDDNLPPAHDFFLDKEMTIADPSKEALDIHERCAMVDTQLDTPLPPGSDVNPALTNQDATTEAEVPQNGGISVSHSSISNEEGDGDVKKDNDGEKGGVVVEGKEEVGENGNFPILQAENKEQV
ncbi:hypothetical protein ACOMHN_040382 [Nucella lapillus]